MNDAHSATLSPTIPELVVTPTTTQIFSFSAVTWNRHWIHFDKDAAIAEGHAGVAVQRALLGNFFAQLLDEWLGERGEVRKLSWKVLSGASPGKKLRCTGEATIDAGIAHCTLSIVDESGAVIVTGKAECMLKQ